MGLHAVDNITPSQRSKC